METKLTSEALSPSLPRSDSTTAEPSAHAEPFETLTPAHLEQDPTDVDSAYAESPEDATESLSLSMLDYRFEHGRRYHAWHDVAYWGPNDEQAQKLQEISHHMYYITFDERLFLAPVINPQAILDVGTEMSPMRSQPLELLGWIFRPFNPHLSLRPARSK
ncbi:hypothetical protein ASPCAL14825 [Aspergillus calidoustus]|uniref:Uncharacterized protein n=1 Tax=Aspergillus calidoustus TaxID=454130 RepID=A0A0U5GIZ2_ASPCI|nr:hypothetical protein ASPCAL14825 [Aspergillus calidoustus]